jgi:nicotinamidase-related amidase
VKPFDVAAGAAAVFETSELEIYQSAGYGQAAPPGTRPVLLIVDVTYAFTGNRSGGGDYPLACGPPAWEAIDHIGRLLEAARGAGVPVVYSRNSPRPTEAESGGWSAKLGPGPEPPRAHEIVDEIAPRAGELVVTKSKPSAFFATPLISWLVQLRVDTVILAGGSTSGCVRASAVDAFSFNLNPFVVAEACFDRSPTSHIVNLFELNQKYATVVSVAEAAPYLAGGADGD